MKLKAIAVAIDFSRHSEEALDYAVGLAKRAGAKIHLFHAFHVPVPGPLADLTWIPRDALSHAREAGARRLEEILDKLREEGIDAELHLCVGDPAAGLSETAAKVGADLIAMGTRGLGGLGRALLGSVAQRTLQQAPCPVLTINSEVALGARPRWWRCEPADAVRVRKLLERALDAIERAADAEVGEPWHQERALELLVELHAELRFRFDREEREAPLLSTLAGMPPSAEPARSLAAERAALLASLLDIVERARGAQRALPEAWEPIRRELGDFESRLLAHESREGGRVLDALLGEGDRDR